VALVGLRVGEDASPACVQNLPGAEVRVAALQARLQAALQAKGSAYRPRTRHLNADGTPAYTNRLILEDSPYLLQHAHNPVDWYPWGEEAFTRARQEHKPILLSVGYSTCHWCHVMEEESFEDDEIAAYINEHYIAIKVDRERRPDIDAVYMGAVQAIAGSGGWPMTVWLTPDRRPFYGGTYFPPRDGDRGVRIGFLTLLARLQDIYRQQPDRVAAAAADTVARLGRDRTVAPADQIPSAAVLRAAFTHLRAGFDAANGGFGGAPKFPRPVQLELLLRYHRRTGDADALEMVQRTLAAMASGGVYDQVGGGFHRYATDVGWLVPHFEKMLYDNALLAVAYLEAYQATGRPELARIAREILTYIQRDMTAPGGAFYSASDADSDGVEGKFFVWTPAEIDAVLSPEAARLAIAYYAVTAPGSFDGANILHTPRPLALVTQDLGIDPAEADRLLASARAGLYAARKQRVAPHTDEKILVAWNGLMISAFARAARALGDDTYLQSASRAAQFILTRMIHDGRLQRSFFAGRASGSGYLDDYAFLVAALLDLYEATSDSTWLTSARALQDVLDQHFWDERGGYFLTADDDEALLVREKPAYDGAEPAGNSVAALNLLRFYELTGDERYRTRADQAFRAFSAAVTTDPTSAPRLLAALDFRLDRPKQIVIVTPGDISDAAPFLAVLAARFVPNRTVTVVQDGPARDELAKTVPLVAEKIAQGGKTTAYVCEQRVCALPTTDPETFARQIERTAPLNW